MPFCPPKPKVQDPSTVGSTLREDFHCLLTSAAFTDLVLVAGGGPTAGGTIVHAHRYWSFGVHLKIKNGLLTCFDFY